MEQVATEMGRFTAAQWRHILDEEELHRDRTADSVLSLLQSLSGVVDGFPVDQLTHACQTASRAERAGAPTEVVVAALCHDIGKAVSDRNHGAISAEILKPYVPSHVYEIVRWHQDFQLRHYADQLGGDPHARDRHRHQPWFGLAETFTDDWDQRSFDPGYDTPPLAHFEPMVREVFRPT